jgi:hypothetical protein
MSESAFSGRSTPYFPWNLWQKRDSCVWHENLFSHLSCLGTRYSLCRTDCRLTACTAYCTARSGLFCVVSEHLCWFKSREILVEFSIKPFNSRELCSEKEINFLVVKCDRLLVVKYDMIWLDIWYDMIWYNITWHMIYLFTAVGLTTGDSSTSHIHTQTLHRTTQWNRIHRILHT